MENSEQKQKPMQDQTAERKTRGQGAFVPRGPDTLRHTFSFGQSDRRGVNLRSFPKSPTAPQNNKATSNTNSSSEINNDSAEFERLLSKRKIDEDNRLEVLKKSKSDTSLLIECNAKDCGKQFESMDDAEDHIVNRHGHKFYCKIGKCDVVASTKHELSLHTCKQDPNKKYGFPATLEERSNDKTDLLRFVQK